MNQLTATLHSVTLLAEGVHSFEFRPADETQRLAVTVTAGAHVGVFLSGGVIRSYSLVNPAGERLRRRGQQTIRFTFDDGDRSRINLAAIVRISSADAYFYCCGTAPMMESFATAAAMRPAQRVHRDYFAASGTLPPAVEGDLVSHQIAEDAAQASLLARRQRREPGALRCHQARTVAWPGCLLSAHPSRTIIRFPRYSRAGVSRGHSTPPIWVTAPR